MTLPTLASSTEWLRADGPAADVVMSARVRLARNLAGQPFMGKLGTPQRQRVMEVCRDAILASRLSPDLAQHLVWIDVHKLSPNERTLLMERHLISAQLSKGRHPAAPVAPVATPPEEPTPDPRGVAFSLPDERLSVMVNEEDHLRLQVIRSGLALGEALAHAQAVDDRLESQVDFAFSPRFGYLTACPTNVGTGLRLSVMLHLPGLKLTGNLEKVERAAKDMSLAVRGFYGEGSQAIGDLFQISNQTTLGKPESVLLQELEREIIPRVIDYERAARRSLASKRRLELEDRCWRALGLLSHARLLTTEEAMEMLSLVRLGVVTGVLTDLDQRRVNELMLIVQPAHLQALAGQPLDQESRRHVRAGILRDRLKKG